VPLCLRTAGCCGGSRAASPQLLLTHPSPRPAWTPARARLPANGDGTPDDTAFFSFLKDTVLNSFDFDGDELPHDLEAMLRTASGSSASLFFDLDRAGSSAAPPPAATAAATPAGGDAAASHGAGGDQEPAARRGAAARGARDAEMADAEDAGGAAAAPGGGRPSRKRARSPSAADAGREDVEGDADGSGAPLAAPARAGPAAAPNEPDTASVDTMPMPSRRRPLDADEVTSMGGANDLVEPLPPGAAGGPRHAARARTAPEGSLNNTAAVAAAAAAAEAEGLFKAVLVAKVLTKSDASSKRVILPRIAIEANLPQLATPGTRTTLTFDALDPSGRTWPLCIKAWANGANPKPVRGRAGPGGESAAEQRARRAPPAPALPPAGPPLRPPPPRCRPALSQPPPPPKPPTPPPPHPLPTPSRCTSWRAASAT
jgi:hypothetical protein